jgi:hypothetical protein
MTIFPTLRMLGFLRRIAKAMERIAEIDQARLELEFPEARKARKRPKVVEFSTANVDDWNAAYREERGL